jgi:hypothetical protein
MDVWDTARLLRIPGVDAHVFIDPAKIPTRTKRGAQRMLRDGFYHGTWGSKTKQLAVLVRDASAPQPFISTRYSRPREGGMQTYYPMQLTLFNYELPMEVVREVIELVRADLSILQMTQPERDGFYHGGVGNQKAFLAEWGNRTKARFSCAAFFCDNYALQAIDLIKATRTPEQVKQAQALADRLDSHEHIPVLTTFK